MMKNKLLIEQFWRAWIPNQEQNLRRVENIFREIKNANIPIVDSNNNRLDTDLDTFKKIFYSERSRKSLYSFLERAKRNRQINIELVPEGQFHIFYKLSPPAQRKEYGGEYKSESPRKVFELKSVGEDLYVDNPLRDIKLINTGEETFQSYDGDYVLKFIKDSNGNVIGGTFQERTAGITKTYDVKKISNQEDDDNQSGANKIKDDEFKCINLFLDRNGLILLSYKLNKPQTWVPVASTHDNEKMEFAFDKDGTAYYRTQTKEKVIKKGKWFCTDDKTSYFIKWDDGTKYIPENSNEDDESGQSSSDNEPQKKTPTPPKTNQCEKYIDVPTSSEVLAGKKVFKKCMKGLVIKRIQEMPTFKSYFFDVLRSNKQDEVTDEFFGIYMEKAVKIFQSTNGIYTLNQKGSGIIDKKTYELLLKQNENRPQLVTQTPQPQTQQAQIQKTSTNQFTSQFATKKTKF